MITYHLCALGFSISLVRVVLCVPPLDIFNIPEPLHWLARGQHCQTIPRLPALDRRPVHPRLGPGHGETQFALAHAPGHMYTARASVQRKWRAHPDLNQGPADLQSAALTTELCTHAQRVVAFSLLAFSAGSASHGLSRCFAILHILYRRCFWQMASLRS